MHENALRWTKSLMVVVCSSAVNFLLDHLWCNYEISPVYAWPWQNRILLGSFWLFLIWDWNALMRSTSWYQFLNFHKSRNQCHFGSAALFFVHFIWKKSTRFLLVCVDCRQIKSNRRVRWIWWGYHHITHCKFSISGKIALCHGFSNDLIKNNIWGLTHSWLPLTTHHTQYNINKLKSLAEW